MYNSHFIRSNKFLILFFLILFFITPLSLIAENNIPKKDVLKSISATIPAIKAIKFHKPIAEYTYTNKITSNKTIEKNAWTVKDELLIKFNQEAKIEKFLNKFNAKIVSNKLDKLGIYIIKINEIGNLKAVIDRISKEPEVKFVEPNFIAASMTSNLYDSNKVAMDIIKAGTLLNGSQNQTVNIGLLDSGVDGTHPELNGKILSGYNAIDGNTNTTDNYGHGTFIAGVISSLSNSNINIVPIKVLGEYGYGDFGTVADGIMYAANNKDAFNIKILLLPFGGYADSPTLHDAIKYAYNKGLTLIAPAGNDNQNIPMYPAAYPEVIAVSATDSNNNRFEVANYGDWVDLSAPGVNIISSSLGGGYKTDSGTSISAAYVAGSAALLYQMFPNLTPDELMYFLTNTSYDNGDKGFDNYYGNGILNIDALLKVGNIIYVDKNSISGIEDGSKNNPYKTIGQATNTAHSGDVIFVSAGIYNEQVNIPDNVKLNSNFSLNSYIDFSAANSTVIDGNGQNIAVIIGDNTELVGFKIINTKQAISLGAVNTSYCLIAYSIIDGKINVGTSKGIKAENANIHINNNRFNNISDIAVDLNNTKSDSEIFSNTFSNNSGVCIRAENGAWGEKGIFENAFADNGFILEPKDAETLDPTLNIVKRNLKNVIEIINTSPLIKDNNIQNSGNNISISGSMAAPLIIYNLIGKAVNGCSVSNGAKPIFRNNRFIDHKNGVDISGSDVLIENNRFIGVANVVKGSSFKLLNNSMFFGFRPGGKDYDVNKCNDPYKCETVVDVIESGTAKGNLHFATPISYYVTKSGHGSSLYPSYNDEFALRDKMFCGCFDFLLLSARKNEGSFSLDPILTNLQYDNFIPFYNFEPERTFTLSNLTTIAGKWDTTYFNNSFTGTATNSDLAIGTFADTYNFKEAGHEFKTVIRFENDDFVKNTGSKNAGFIFGYQNENNYYFARIDNSYIIMGQRINGKDYLLKDAKGRILRKYVNIHTQVSYDLSLLIYRDYNNSPVKKVYDYSVMGGFRSYFVATGDGKDIYTDNYKISLNIRSNDPLGRSSINCWENGLTANFSEISSGLVGLVAGKTKTRFDHITSNPISSPLIDSGDSGSSYKDVNGTRNDIGEYGGPNSPKSIILDNSDANVFRMIPASQWSQYSSNSSYNKAKSYVTNANSGSAAEFLVSADPGTYEIYFWWPNKDNLAADVPVTIIDSNGNEKTIYVDQTGNDKSKQWIPGRWNYLTTAKFNSNDIGKIVVNDNVSQSNTMIAVDAVMLVRTMPDKVSPYVSDQNPWNKCTRVLRNGYSGITFQGEIEWPFVPTRYQSNSFVNPSISLALRDDGSGVDANSVVVHITSLKRDITLNKNSKNLEVVGPPRNLIVNYTPDFLFDYEEVVQISVSANDRATPANSFSETYSFTIKPDVDPPTTTAIPGWGIYDSALVGNHAVGIYADEPCEIYYTIGENEWPTVGGQTTLHKTAVETTLTGGNGAYKLYKINVDIASDTVLRFFGVDILGNKEELSHSVRYIINPLAPDFSNAIIEPKIAKIGDTITITFVADQVLETNPTVLISGKTGDIPATYVSGKTLELNNESYDEIMQKIKDEFGDNIYTPVKFIYTYKLTGDESEGKNKITIS
ncbi:S8 family serine peptidase, partial [Candidatus Poribacteria bacterium]|nr:S8 family serine peptidase [Candidatus Poribacteria bacterium]